MNSPEKMQEDGPRELSGRTEYCNSGEKRGVMQGGLKGEEAEGKVWNCGMCICASHLALSNQLTLCLDTGLCFVLQSEGVECTFSGEGFSLFLLFPTLRC